MACPDLLGTISPIPNWAKYNAAGDGLWTSSASPGTQFNEHTYPDLGLVASHAGIGSAAWALVPDATNTIYRTSSGSIYTFRAGEGAVFLVGIFTIDGVQTGQNRPIAYSVSDGKLYVLTDGNGVGARLMRFGLDGTHEATVHTFDPGVYDATVSTPSQIEVLDGVVYGLLFSSSSSFTRFGFAYDIATDTVTVGPSTDGLVTLRGVHHDGCAIYQTNLGTYVRMFPDGTVAPLGCEAIDNSLDDVSWLTTYTRDGLDKTLFHVRYNTGTDIEYRIYEELTAPGLDVPTLALPGFQVPFRGVDAAIRREQGQ